MSNLFTNFPNGNINNFNIIFIYELNIVYILTYNFIYFNIIEIDYRYTLCNFVYK